jgi:hypothetical protein
MQKVKKLSNDDIGVLFLIAAFLLGAWFRISPIITAEFPVNDGGLFYKMIATVQESNFSLPTYIKYNDLDIPFAYPPLAFYLAALIGRMFNASILDLQMWMPATTVIIILPCIFYLSKLLLKSTLQAGIATFFYALLPRAITWFVMGGGITRSLGQLFLILATSQIYLLFTKRSRKFIISSIIFSTAVCATHPEAALHTIGIALILWFFFGRTREDFFHAILVGAGTLIFTSPWWIKIILRFGLDPYIAAGQTGFHSFFSVLAVFLPFSEEPLLPMIAFFAILGSFAQIAKRQYFLPVWLITHFIIEPRNAPNVATIPAVLLASICLTEVILPNLARFESTQAKTSLLSIARSRTERLLLGYLIISLLINMLIAEQKLNQYHLSPEERTAMEWIKTNTPQGSKFIIITGDFGLFSDYVNEWFPIFADRQSHTTIQGYEWIKDVKFNTVEKTMKDLQKCIETDSLLDCVETTSEDSKLKYDYVVLMRNARHVGNLTADLVLSKYHQLIYKSTEVIIFAREN